MAASNMEAAWANIVQAAGNMSGGQALANALGTAGLSLGISQLPQLPGSLSQTMPGFSGGLSQVSSASFTSTGLIGAVPSLNTGGLMQIAPPSQSKAADPATEMAIGQIKELQKTDREAKGQWDAYCDMQGDGKRDPAKHTLDFLQGFLMNFHAGARLPVSEEEDTELTTILKTMQRKSMAFKTAWANYCLQHGQGMNDPAKHDHDFHIEFLDGLAEKALTSMISDSDDVAAKSSDGPPAKKSRTEAGPPPAPGDILAVRCTKGGREPHQAVGYLDDGTMVIVNNASQFIGGVCPSALVLSSKPTSAGHIVFCKLQEPGDSSWGSSSGNWNSSSSWIGGGSSMSSTASAVDVPPPPIPPLPSQIPPPQVMFPPSGWTGTAVGSMNPGTSGSSGGWNGNLSSSGSAGWNSGLSSASSSTGWAPPPPPPNGAGMGAAESVAWGSNPAIVSWNAQPNGSSSHSGGWSAGSSSNGSSGDWSSSAWYQNSWSPPGGKGGQQWPSAP